MKIPEVLFFQEGPGVRKWQFTSSGVKLLNGGNINDNKLDLKTTDKYLSTEEAYGKYSHFLVQPGDLLIACSGIVVEKFDGKIAYATDEDLPLCMNTSTMRFRSLDPAILSIDYFAYFLRSRKFKSQIQKLITGSAQLNFGPSHIKKVKIPLPPIETQRQIAHRLDLIDRLRRSLRAEVAAYGALGEAVFLEMFGDPVRNEMGWEVVPFSKVGELDRGKSKHRPRNAPELLGGKYPLIQTGDVAKSKGYLTSYSATYSEFGLKQSKIWPTGTLCITIAANIAKTGILTFDACFPDSVVGFTPSEKTNVIYVQHWMSFLQKILEDGAPESAQKNINLKILRSLDFMNPPVNLQHQFAARIRAIEALRGKAELALGEADGLFGATLQRVFGG